MNKRNDTTTPEPDTGTDALPTDETAQPATEATDTDTDSDTGTEEPDAGGNAEAAKWRRKLRDTQAELDSVTAQLDAVRRQQVEHLLAKSGVKPQAVFAVAEMADLLGDDGTIDTDKLSAAIRTAQDRFGIIRPAKGTYVPGLGNQPSGVPSVDRWSEAFSPKRR